MNIALSPEQRTWLEAEVAAGRFGSIDDAVAAAVAELMSLAAAAASAKPRAERDPVSDARADIMSGEEVIRRLEGRLGKLGAA
jgi:Arc/MetJ-type ribon-helix-helix transcriptional regulator